MSSFIPASISDTHESFFISPRIDKVIASLSPSQRWISVEFFPPRSDEAVETLFEHIQALQRHKPIFVDMTWGAGGGTSDLTVSLCRRMLGLGLRPNMHLTCTNMDEDKVDQALMSCKQYGIVNVLALRGDPPVGQQWKASEGGFSSAFDLVKHVRGNDKFKSDDFDFCLSVAGYPEGHPSKITKFSSVDDMSASELSRHSIEVTFEGSDGVDPLIELWSCRDEDFDAEIQYLKKKIDAGSNMIITQMFFDAEVYVSFVAACRSGIYAHTN